MRGNSRALKITFVLLLLVGSFTAIGIGALLYEVAEALEERKRVKG